ncbi:hypothetical protein [Sphingomonas sp. 3-13AW]|uniref:hypothetical protein n=1 Tax=Sphingomonas sp. 3-13AW TaxID=3050450 RepID=UPI003BB55497
MSNARQYTRAQVARFKAIDASKKAKAAAQDSAPQGEVVQMKKKFVLQDIDPFDAMISFTETNRGMTKGEEPRPFATLKGVEFMVDGVAYTRTCMAYGPAAEAINTMLDGGTTMFEVELTPNYNTMKITGLVIDGVFTAFPDERSVDAEGRLAA